MVEALSMHEALYLCLDLVLEHHVARLIHLLLKKYLRRFDWPRRNEW